MAVLLGILAGVLNFVACMFMMRTESSLIRDGKLPERGILHVKDYNFFMWGNRLVITIMDFAILYVLVQGWPLAAKAIVISMFGAVVWTGIWDTIWRRPSHRPDSFYPLSGVVSRLGRIQLVYFSVQYFLGFMGLWMVGYMLAGYRPWSWVAAIGLISAAVYYMILGADFLAGKFKRIPVQPG